MPDMTLCRSTNCPLRNSCLRSTRSPSENRYQSYFAVSPYSLASVKAMPVVMCEYFVSNGVKEDAKV